MIVPRIGDALLFFVDVLGMEVAYRGPAAQAAGETAVLDGGNIAVTLLEPAESGVGMLADRRPRITQLVFGVPGETVLELSERIRSAGLPIRSLDDGRAFVPPEIAEGVLGFDTALMFSRIEP